MTDFPAFAQRRGCVVWPLQVKPWVTACCAAKVAELVDALDLGSSVARRESSSLSFRTIA